MPCVSEQVRRLPIGAEVRKDGVHFRVWAPKARRVEVQVEGAASAPLEAESEGYHAGFIAGLTDGARYRFVLDGRGSFPDPASRYQPEGPHGPSQVIDGSRFPWTDGAWRGAGRTGQVLYELHLGTFTPEGTWASAAKELPRLRDLGITLLEVMPVAEFPGRFGWGYDGVDLFAPTRLYGSPEEFRRFVDRAHALGLGVILDVVYNHLGPDGNYLSQFSAHYFSDKTSDWGASINFDGPESGPVREFFIANASYWISEFHLDGLRFDATQAIHDDSPEHILTAIQREARRSAGVRSLFLVAENDHQQAGLVRPSEEKGLGLDAVWNDDFHHSARVALTGRREGYFRDFHGTPQELISAVRWGYLYQGQHHSFSKKSRGSPALDLPGAAFVNFLENHDQVANSGHGGRLAQLSHPGLRRALTALLLLAPGTPMLFQGQEYFSPEPFLYFADHPAPLGILVAQGRGKFLSDFASLAGPEAQAALPDPTRLETFRRCVLDPAERDRHPEAQRLHRDLLALRRSDPVLGSQRSDRLAGAVLSPEALVLRYFGPGGDDRLLLLNLGVDLVLRELAEPLLASPAGGEWTLRWSSEELRYGGAGAVHPFDRDALVLQGRSAVVLQK